MKGLDAVRSSSARLASKGLAPGTSVTVGRTALASVVVLLTAACGGTSPSSKAPAGSPSIAASVRAARPIPIPALSLTFTSPTMGYSVNYPTGWAVSLATEPWPLGRASFWDTRDGDRLEGESAGFRGSSQALGSGQSAAEWMDQYMASSMPCGKREQVRVSGAIGTIDLNDCPGMGRLRGRVFDLVVVAGGRGYNFTMEGRVDRAFFLEELATVRFSPPPPNS